MSKEEEVKEQKLLLYIKTAFHEYQQGNKTKFNGILDEISNRNKSEQLLSLWLRAIIRLVGESQKNKPVFLTFARGVLTKTSWFHSENHLKIHTLFRRFLSILVSLFYELSDFVYKFLLSKIGEDERDFEKKPERKILIQQAEFDSPDDLLKFIKNKILIAEKYTAKDPLCQEIIRLDPPDQEFMLEVFRHHKHYEEKFQGFSHLGVGDFTHGPLKEKTRCFFVVKSDPGKKPVDISYLKSVQFLVESLKEKGEVFSSENLKRIELIASIVRDLLKIYPISKASLIQFLNEAFPHKKSSENALQLYLAFLLSVATQNPKLLPEIFSIATEKLISIDVEIKLDDTANFTEGEHSLLSFSNDENAKKLDLLMNLMLSFLQSVVTHHRASIFQNADLFPEIEKLNIFDPLLGIFQERLLVIYQSKYTQFLLFYLTSFQEKSQRLIEEFLSLLITNALQENQAKIIRNNSISYLSSFLARAKFLSSEHLMKSLGFLIEFLEEYDLVEEGDIEPKRMKVLKTAKLSKEPENSHFLLILQGALYVVCYHQALCEDRVFVERISRVLVRSQRYQGFKGISIEILQEFLRKTGTALPELKDPSEGVSKESEISAKSELFFPFDPYLLKKSEGFLRDIYRFWNDEAPEDGEQKLKGKDCEKETDSSSPFIIEEAEQGNEEPQLKRKRVDVLMEEEEPGLMKKIKK